MARPKPTVLCSHEGAAHNIDILAAQNFWGVTYAGKLVSMRYRHHTVTGEMSKYPKTMFPSAAAARNCAVKLNQTFNTDQFDISRVVSVGVESAPEPDLTEVESVEPN